MPSRFDEAALPGIDEQQEGVRARMQLFGPPAPLQQVLVGITPRKDWVVHFAALGALNPPG